MHATIWHCMCVWNNIFSMHANISHDYYIVYGICPIHAMNYIVYGICPIHAMNYIVYGICPIHAMNC